MLKNTLNIYGTFNNKSLAKRPYITSLSLSPLVFETVYFWLSILPSSTEAEFQHYIVHLNVGFVCFIDSALETVVGGAWHRSVVYCYNLLPEFFLNRQMK